VLCIRTSVLARLSVVPRNRLWTSYDCTFRQLVSQPSQSQASEAGRARLDIELLPVLTAAGVGRRRATQPPRAVRARCIVRGCCLERDRAAGSVSKEPASTLSGAPLLVWPCYAALPLTVRECTRARRGRARKTSEVSSPRRGQPVPTKQRKYHLRQPAMPKLSDPDKLAATWLHLQGLLHPHTRLSQPPL
jgi:hypothetical protein